MVRLEVQARDGKKARASTAAEEKQLQRGAGRRATKLQEYIERRRAKRLDELDRLIVQTARLSPGQADEAPYDFARDVLIRYIAAHRFVA